MCCSTSGASRGDARPATRLRAPFASFTRAATAPAPTSCGTAASAATRAAARRTKPPRPRWASSAPPADCWNEPWWWSTRASATTTAPTPPTVTQHCGGTDPDRPAELWFTQRTCKKQKAYTSLSGSTSSNEWTLREKMLFVDKDCDWVWMNLHVM